MMSSVLFEWLVIIKQNLKVALCTTEDEWYVKNWNSK